MCLNRRNVRAICLRQIETIIGANEETKKKLLQNMNMILCSFIPFPLNRTTLSKKKTPTQTLKRRAIRFNRTVAGFNEFH